jgi:hypothetical protein
VIGVFADRASRDELRSVLVLAFRRNCERIGRGVRNPRFIGRRTRAEGRGKRDSDLKHS